MRKSLPIGRVGLVLLVLLGGCSRVRHPPPVPGPPARAWLLDAHAFPPEWQAFPCTIDCERREGETHAYRGFGIKDVPGHAIQNVYRLVTEREAAAMFRTYRQADFAPPDPPDTQYVPPTEVTYHSATADEYYMGCGINGGAPVCYAIFRYERYFIDLYVHIDRGQGYGIKMEELEPILRALDRRAAEVLDQPVLEGTPTL